jgi:hypothetical protein
LRQGSKKNVLDVAHDAIACELQFVDILRESEKELVDLSLQLELPTR